MSPVQVMPSRTRFDLDHVAQALADEHEIGSWNLLTPEERDRFRRMAEVAHDALRADLAREVFRHRRVRERLRGEVGKLAVRAEKDARALRRLLGEFAEEDER